MTTPVLAYKSPQTTDATSPRRSHWLGWAVFLGMSWTWCIGMFLPVLLIREYGVWGWVVFAIPNVVGAAAMGWVIRSAESSVQIVAAHRFAAQLFSAVTIAFHLFFVLAVITPLSVSLIEDKRQAMTYTLGAMVVAALFMYQYMKHRAGADRTLAWCALAISCAAMVYVTFEVSQVVATHPDRMAPLPTKFNVDLLSLAPVCIFGFLACPYLDLTFHRARQESAGPRRSFGIGFGVFFFLMIIFTLIYARPYLADGWNRYVTVLLVVHMAVQSAYTLAAHARELRYRGAIASVFAAALTLAAWAAYWVLPDGKIAGGQHAGEVIYRVFIGFYGLVFPAYVWLVMLPGRGQVRLSVLKLLIFFVAVAVVLPMFWMGFILQRMIWLIPGLAMVLLARLLIPAQKSHGSAVGMEISETQTAQQNSAPT